MGGNLAKLIRASRGPVLLMTLGALLAVNQFTGFSFDQTFPVLIIVFGMMWLLERMAPRQAVFPAATVAGGSSVSTGQPQTSPPPRSPFEPETAYDPLQDVHRRVYGTDVPPPVDKRDFPTAEHPSRQVPPSMNPPAKGGQ